MMKRPDAESLSRWIVLFPPLERKDRIALVENLEESSRWSMNFGVMLGCSVLIAFLAGVAAGYAMARPKMSGALPGVAISVALVPPPAAAGIALGSADWMIALGAVLLFATNMVAIVLGSAMVFRMHGIRTPKENRTTLVQMKRIILGLGLTLVVFTAPLIYQFISQLRQGQSRPESLTLSEGMWIQLHDRLDREEGIDFLTGVRASTERPEDVILVISADRPVPGELLAELDRMIDEGMGEDITVKMNIVRQGSVIPVPESRFDEVPPEIEPVINE